MNSIYDENKLRLCVGVFLVLLFQALKPRTKTHNSWHAQNDGLDEVTVVSDLAKIVDPHMNNLKKCSDRSIKSVVSRYKLCKISRSSYLPFDNSIKVDMFRQRIANNWHECLLEMVKLLVDKVVTDTPSTKDELLVSSLIDIIEHDNSVSDGEKFLIKEDGSSVAKSEMIRQNRFNFYSFILGIWHFIIVNRRNNQVGKETISFLCPSNGGTKRVYSANLGKRYSESLQLTYTFDENSKSGEHINETSFSTDRVKDVFDNDITPSKSNISFIQNNFNGPIKQYIENLESLVNINYGK